MVYILYIYIGKTPIINYTTLKKNNLCLNERGDCSPVLHKSKLQAMNTQLSKTQNIQSDADFTFQNSLGTTYTQNSFINLTSYTAQTSIANMKNSGIFSKKKLNTEGNIVGNIGNQSINNKSNNIYIYIYI